MSYPTLRIGSKGKSVTDLQNLLNKKLTGGTRLATDGDFDQKTKKAVVQFQLNNWLVGDGIVGPCTWNCITGNEKYAVFHPIGLVPQPTSSTCWAAATAMLLGQPSPVVLPEHLKESLVSEGGLLNDSKLDNPQNMMVYCNHFRLKWHPPQSYLPDGLYDLLKRKPAMANILWDTDSYTRGVGSSGHMVVITGIRGNGEANGTTVRVNDPWPVGSGSVRSFNYAQMIKNTPAYTYHLYQRI